MFGCGCLFGAVSCLLLCNVGN